MISRLLHRENACKAQKLLKRQTGLSLLELLVAFSIMAMSFAMIYRISGGSVKTIVQVDEKQRAVSLVETLLDSRDFVSEEGWNESGETGGMQWQVQSVRYLGGIEREYPLAVPLHELQITVSWKNGNQLREVSLKTLRPQRKAVPVTGGR